MDYIEAIGTVAAILTTTAFVPQVYKTWRERSTKDISLAMYSAMLTGVLLWLVYGILIDNFPLILANVITAILLIIMLLLKLRYK